MRTALGLIRERRLGLLGAVGYWGFDIAVLGVSFRAFGSAVPVAVLVMGYFLGTLGSLLPLPGGIGGVEGGMIGAFAAFGVPAGRAVVAVLAYRAISFWLPTLPGIAGYVTLRSTVRRWRTPTAQQRQPAEARTDAARRGDRGEAATGPPGRPARPATAGAARAARGRRALAGPARRAARWSSGSAARRGRG